MPTERVARRIHDILENIGSIEDYTQGLTRDTFADHAMAVDAVERCLERIAEAARKLGDRFDAQAAPDVDLHDVRQFGSVLRHDYDVLDSGVLWNVVVGDLPKLKTLFEGLGLEYPVREKRTDPGYDPF